MTLSLPAKLVILHSVLIVLFMFTLWNRWFLTDIPFDCFYAPFFLISGPVVYSIAHYVQHRSEQFFSVETSVFLPCDVVPGIVCLNGASRRIHEPLRHRLCHRLRAVAVVARLAGRPTLRATH